LRVGVANESPSGEPIKDGDSPPGFETGPPDRAPGNSDFVEPFDDRRTSSSVLTLPSLRRRSPGPSEIRRRRPTPLRPQEQVHRAGVPTAATVRLRPLMVGRRGRLLLMNGSLLLIRALGVFVRHGRDARRMGELVARFARDMGGLWIRFASFLADHRITLPNEFCQVLLEMHERTDGFSFDVVRKVVEQDLGRSLEDVFETFDLHPIAATFTSQTHAARLRTERAAVAVKVQRPGTLETIRADLRLMRFLRPALLRLTGIPAANWEDGVRRIETGLAVELDYRLEATNMVRFGRRLRKHRVLVPRVYTGYSGRHILTKEYVEGVTVAEYVKTLREDRPRTEQWLADNRISPDKVGRRLFHSLMRQVLEEDLFHRDWNRFNILLLTDNYVAIVDFWAMVTIERAFQSRMRMFLRAIAEREFRKAADYFLLLGPPLSPRHDVGEVRRRVIHSLRTFDVRARARLVAYDEKTLTSTLGEIGRIVTSDGAPPTRDLLHVERAFRILDLSLKDLLPRANVMKLHEDYWRRSYARQLQRRVKPRSLRRTISAAVELVATGPEALSEQFAVGADLIRRQAKVFQQTSGKIAQLFESVFRMIALGFLAVAAVLVFAFVGKWRQASPEDSRWIGRDGIRLLESVPPLDTLEGGLLLVVILYLAKAAWKLKLRFAEKTLNRPSESEL